MARRVFAFCLVAVLAAGGAGVCQNVAGGGEGNAVATFKAAAQLVLVDVVVTDRDHKPVHGLKAEDFSVTEGGVPQTVKHFDEHTALTQADATKFPPVEKLPPGIFSNYTPAPANGAVNLILLDMLNTPMVDQNYVREQLLAYLKATPPGTRIAIFALRTRLIMLQGFTSDPDALRQVVESTMGRGSPLLDDKAGGSGARNSTADNIEESFEKMHISAPELIASVRDFEEGQQDVELGLRAKYTLDALNGIARYLANVPGRKNLIWFSESFPLDILRDTSGKKPGRFAGMDAVEVDIPETVNLLTRSQVAIYPIDARGVMDSGTSNAASDRRYVYPYGPALMREDEEKFAMDTAEEHETMRDMANGTGGHAFTNTNGLTAAVASAIEDGTNFYTLAYTPSNVEHDGRFRKIEVHVSRPGMTMAYRKGYFAETLNPKVAKLESATVDSARSTGDSLNFAMIRGAPAPSEVILKVGVVPMTPEGQTENKVVAGNQLSAKTKGPFRRYSVNYSIEPGGLSFVRGDDGLVHANFDLLILVYTADGELVNAQTNSVTVAKSPDELKEILAQGLIFHEEVSTPAKGEYFLRIGVHDLHLDHYGAVEVATSSVKDVRFAAH